MNPYTEMLTAINKKIAQEREMEVTVKLKGKHLSALRRLVFNEGQAGIEDKVLLKEINTILYDAQQRI